MTLRKLALVLGALLGPPLAGVPAGAEVPAEQAARLGADLTPLGAERAGNAAGTIPAWTGGITEAPAGYEPGDAHPDPHPGDAARDRRPCCGPIPRAGGCASTRRAARLPTRSGCTRR